jgi:uncharacterized protein (TIGR00661 family)
MKIFYAVQANGNGHISRALQLNKHLKEYGEVDFFLSGNNAQLDYTIPIKFKSEGVNLFYKDKKGLDYYKTVKSICFKDIVKKAKSLPLYEYDLVINDFEFVTSLSCILYNKPSIHFGHQASFQSNLTPKAKCYDPLGKMVLKNFVKSNQYLGLHFKSYDDNIFNPIIKEEIINVTPIDEGHIAVYLPQYSINFLEPFLLLKSKYRFEVFTKELTISKRVENIDYYPINNEDFTSSLIRSKGIITAGGFETPSEAMYLKKKLLCIPVKNHFEQECNAEALRQLGIKVISKIDKDFSNTFDKWVTDDKIIGLHLSHSTKDIVAILMSRIGLN